MADQSLFLLVLALAMLLARPVVPAAVVVNGDIVVVILFQNLKNCFLLPACLPACLLLGCHFLSVHLFFHRTATATIAATTTAATARQQQ